MTTASDARLHRYLHATIAGVRAWHGPLVAFDHREPPHTTRRTLLDLGVLAACGIALVALTHTIAQWRVVATHYRTYTAFFVIELALYALAAAWVIWRKPPVRWTLALIFLIALCARLTFIPQTPTVSDDVYRYVWDGHIQAAGINPYRYAPNDPAVARFRDRAIYPGINRKPVPTIYPPVAQGVFRLIYALHPNSVAWTKLALSLLDLATAVVLVILLVRAGIRPERVLLYAWHPLLILEVGHSGHIDVVAALFIALALWARTVNRSALSGVLLACATLVKFYALVALPALLATPRRNVRLLAGLIVTTVLAYLPFLSVGTRVLGFLPGYVQQEGISSGKRYYLLHQATWLVDRLPGVSTLLAHSPLAILSATTWYEGGIVAAMIACAFACWLRPATSVRGMADRIAVLFIVLLTLATPSQPWYVLLLLTCVPLVRGAMLLPTGIVVGSAGFGYLNEWFPSRPVWPLVVNYDGRAVALVLVCIIVVAQWRAERRRPAALANPFSDDHWRVHRPINRQ
ncbi:MAG: glycosyltransferase 87 family protein [Chloroflexota bacterium]|nr:glycosyltransferase 87 family protein [Chloroflexota bacterium]